MAYAILSLLCINHAEAPELDWTPKDPTQQAHHITPFPDIIGPNSVPPTTMRSLWRIAGALAK
ncbi:hypothetical protein DPV78_012063 [Talaromyces pinophilus]|nr:hypothetical protein DPV78_012063 [Talaromyces pinophilus]